jgi:hypothetical protein
MGNPLQAVCQALDLMPTGPLNFKPFDFEDLVIFYGTPPIQLRGLDSIEAKRHHPQAKFFPKFGGGGRFLSNQNISGEVKLRFIAASWSLGYLEIFDFFGADNSLLVTDIGSGGTSTIVGSACKMTDKGTWSRADGTPIVEITLEADRLWFFHGVRLLND